MLTLPTREDQVTEFIQNLGMKDTLSQNTLEDGVKAVILASDKLDADLWKYLKNYKHDEDIGFMFSQPTIEIKGISDNMKIGHSGSSYAWTMRWLQKLAVENYCEV